MALSWYNGFSPEQREQGDKWIKKAVADGRLAPLNTTKCHYCGQEQGIRHYHCEDYSTEEIVVGTSIPVCWVCHMMIHRKGRHPASYRNYFDRVKQGYMPKPVFTGNQWQALNKYTID
jgi:hypothetical protein